jgi:hypothetical protein
MSFFSFRNTFNTPTASDLDVPSLNLVALAQAALGCNEGVSRDCKAATFGQECPSTGILPTLRQMVKNMSTDTVPYTLGRPRRIVNSERTNIRVPQFEDYVSRRKL